MDLSLFFVGCLLLGVLVIFTTTPLSRRRLWKQPGLSLLLLFLFGYGIHAYLSTEAFQSGTKSASCSLPEMGAAPAVAPVIVPFVDSVPPTLPAGLTFSTVPSSITAGTTYTLIMDTQFISTYNRLAYILVGGGGAGATFSTGGGGGGSGRLASNVVNANIPGLSLTRTDYNLSTLGPTTTTEISLTQNLTALSLQIGTGGGGSGNATANNGNPTTLSYNSATYIANGGSGGSSGTGGTGYNAGGSRLTVGAGTGAGRAGTGINGGGGGAAGVGYSGTGISGGDGAPQTTRTWGLPFSGGGGGGGFGTEWGSGGQAGYAVLIFYNRP